MTNDKNGRRNIIAFRPIGVTNSDLAAIALKY